MGWTDNFVARSDNGKLRWVPESKALKRMLRRASRSPVAAAQAHNLISNRLSSMVQVIDVLLEIWQQGDSDTAAKACDEIDETLAKLRASLQRLKA